MFVGFGSMAGGHGDRLLPLVAAALRAAGVRGIVQAGRAGLGAPGSGPSGSDLLAVGDVPHAGLGEAVRAAVEQPRYRAAARRMSEVVADDGATGAVVGLVERLAAG